MHFDAEALIEELKSSGEKFTLGDIMAIGRQRNGQLVWLEKGRSSAGFIHIIGRHKADFEKKGIHQNEIPYYLMTAVTEGEIIGYQGKDKGRAIYEFFYNGQMH